MKRLFIGAGSNEGIQKEQFIEVLNPRKSYKNLAQVTEVLVSTQCVKIREK